MNFTVKDRILLVGMLPPQGDFKTIKLLHDLRIELAFSEKENEDFGIQSANGSVSWDGEAGKAVKEIEVGPTMFELIKGLIKDLDEAKQLTENHISLYEMFMAE